MKRFSEQLKKKSIAVRLTPTERADLESRLISFMEYHPLITPRKAVTGPRRMISPPFSLIQIPAQYVRSLVGVLAIILVVSVPALAEQAIPGDILYPIKGVTEEIRGSLNLDSYEKVAWETTRLERRIAEARLLAEAGRLTPEVEAGVLAAVQVQKAATESEIESLRTTDAEGATLAQLTFATMLDLQSSVLKANDSASTTAGMSTVALADVLQAGQVEVSGRGDLENISVERLRAQLEIETTRSYELLQSIENIATEKERADVKRRLADLERKLAKEDSDEVTLKLELRNAWRDVQKLISFMTDIDVRATLAIESLVPVVLTESERTAAVVRDYEIASQNHRRIEAGLSLVTDAAVAEKINLALPKVAELLKTATTTLITDIGAAEIAVTEARALTESMITLSFFPPLAELREPESSTTVVTEIDITTPTSSATTTDSENEAE